MRISQYIIIKRRDKYHFGSRMTKESPRLESNEVAVKVTLEIPDAIFEKPALEAQITIPNEAVSKPVISAEVIDNVQEIIKQNTGFEVKLEVVNAKEEE